MTNEQLFRALSLRHRWLAGLFRDLKASGHLEAAEATFWTAARVWDEAQAAYRSLDK